MSLHLICLYLYILQHPVSQDMVLFTVARLISTTLHDSPLLQWSVQVYLVHWVLWWETCRPLVREHLMQPQPTVHGCIFTKLCSSAIHGGWGMLCIMSPSHPSRSPYSSTFQFSSLNLRGNCVVRSQVKSLLLSALNSKFSWLTNLKLLIVDLFVELLVEAKYGFTKVYI